MPSNAAGKRKADTSDTSSDAKSVSELESMISLLYEKRPKKSAGEGGDEASTPVYKPTNSTVARLPDMKMIVQVLPPAISRQSVSRALVFKYEGDQSPVEPSAIAQVALSSVGRAIYAFPSIKHEKMGASLVACNSFGFLGVISMSTPKNPSDIVPGVFYKTDAQRPIYDIKEKAAYAVHAKPSFALYSFPQGRPPALINHEEAYLDAGLAFTAIRSNLNCLFALNKTKRLEQQATIDAKLPDSRFKPSGDMMVELSNPRRPKGEKSFISVEPRNVVNGHNQDFDSLMVLINPPPCKKDPNDNEGNLVLNETTNIGAKIVKVVHSASGRPVEITLQMETAAKDKPPPCATVCAWPDLLEASMGKTFTNEAKGYAQSIENQLLGTKRPMIFFLRGNIFPDPFNTNTWMLEGVAPLDKFDDKCYIRIPPATPISNLVSTSLYNSELNKMYGASAGYLLANERAVHVGVKKPTSVDVLLLPADATVALYRAYMKAYDDPAPPNQSSSEYVIHMAHLQVRNTIQGVPTADVTCMIRDSIEASSALFPPLKTTPKHIAGAILASKNAEDETEVPSNDVSSDASAVNVEGDEDVTDSMEDSEEANLDLPRVTGEYAAGSGSILITFLTCINQLCTSEPHLNVFKSLGVMLTRDKLSSETTETTEVPDPSDGVDEPLD